MPGTSIVQEFDNFFAGFPVHLQKFFIGLGHVAPLLTTAAVVAETVTGSGVLIPETEAAGKAAENVGAALESGSVSGSGSTTDVLKVVASSVAGVADAAGAGSVKTEAEKVLSVFNPGGVTV